MIEENDFIYIQRRFDQRYKRVDDCEREMKDATEEHHRLDKRLAVIENQQKINNWLTAAIAGGIIALVVKLFVGG